MTIPEEGETLAISTPADCEQYIQFLRTFRGQFPFLPRQAYARSFSRNEIVCAYNSTTTLVCAARFYDREDGQRTIYEIATHPDHRRQGYGSNLMDWLKFDAEKSSLDKISLSCPETSPANSFYTACGLSISKTKVSRAGNRLMQWEIMLNA